MDGDVVVGSLWTSDEPTRFVVVLGETEREGEELVDFDVFDVAPRTRINSTRLSDLRDVVADAFPAEDQFWVGEKLGHGWWNFVVSQHVSAVFARGFHGDENMAFEGFPFSVAVGDDNRELPCCSLLFRVKTEENQLLLGFVDLIEN